MDPKKVYEIVKSSPEIVGRHDREAWLGLFAEDAEVNDPVGAGPNYKNQDIKAGRDALGRFYDIFIAPNDIKFQVFQDIVIENEVVRDVLITTTLPNGAISEVAALLKYSVKEVDGELKIDTLNAYWDFTGNAIALLANNGLKGIVASCQQFGSMIAVQGMPRVIEYCGAMYKGILCRGNKAVGSFADAINANDEGVYSRLFDSGAVIEFPANKAVSAADFFKDAADMTMRVSSVRSGGWFTSCVFDAAKGKSKMHGVAFFEFSPKSKKIVKVRFFYGK